MLLYVSSIYITTCEHVNWANLLFKKSHSASHRLQPYSCRSNPIVLIHNAHTHTHTNTYGTEKQILLNIYKLTIICLAWEATQKNIKNTLYISLHIIHDQNNSIQAYEYTTFIILYIHTHIIKLQYLSQCVINDLTDPHKNSL